MVVDSRGAASCLSLIFWGMVSEADFPVRQIRTFTLPSMSLLTGWKAMEPNTSSLVSNNPHG